MVQLSRAMYARTIATTICDNRKIYATFINIKLITFDILKFNYGMFISNQPEIVDRLRRKKIEMSFNCTDCGGVVELPEDAAVSEIVECSDCGLEYVVEQTEDGLLVLKELTLVGEDWGE